MDSNPIVDKIRKLLLKAERGATQEEAELLLAKAQELMTAHGIKFVSTEEGQDRPNVYQVIKHYHKTGRQRYETDQYISSILKRCYNVNVLWSAEYENVTLTVKRGEGRIERSILKQRLVYLLVGQQTDIELACLIIETLHPMMRSLLAAHLRAENVKWNAVTCHSFFEGLQHAFILANEKGSKQAMIDAGESASGKYQLALVNQLAVRSSFIKENITTSKSRCRSGAMAGGHDPLAYAKGYEAGAKINPTAKRIK